jgi:hypothetical protein
MTIGALGSLSVFVRLADELRAQRGLSWDVLARRLVQAERPHKQERLTMGEHPFRLKHLLAYEKGERLVYFWEFILALKEALELNDKETRRLRFAYIHERDIHEGEAVLV